MMVKVASIATVLLMPAVVPVAVIATAAYLLRRDLLRRTTADTPARSSSSTDADRTARLFAAIDEMTHAATDVIVADRPGVDPTRIRRAMGQELHHAVLELAELARGI